MKHGTESGDVVLVQIVDAALAEAARKSGPWLVCRPGCIQCCIGPFAITQLDAWRLQRALADLAQADPARANRVRERAHASIARLPCEFPGDPVTGLLASDEFPVSMDDEPCPALDLET